VQNASNSPEFVQNLSEVQDENGTDLGLLKRHLQLSEEERLRLLEQQLNFATALQAATSRALEPES
jgi:hypothetical protein